MLTDHHGDQLTTFHWNLYTASSQAHAVDGLAILKWIQTRFTVPPSYSKFYKYDTERQGLFKLYSTGACLEFNKQQSPFLLISTLFSIEELNADISTVTIFHFLLRSWCV